MSTASFTIKTILYILLIAWLLVFTKYILFKRSPGYYKQYFRAETLRRNYKEGLKQVNLVPFKTIRFMFSNNLDAEFRVDNIAGNIGGFIPLSILLLLLYPALRKV